ncbi:tRNA lysidine(34) synthetase TilS [uncultured Clostridium sp.]|uniref:tRNA lysidine(34) synthetase TilS n=1 Tax=uncultured Clostridium sp. TaxID=59620 RepID=UPI002609A7DF|nr:tRNA lysidine(34) synthetase TilS [uncultured Clostridium sp.]
MKKKTLNYIYKNSMIKERDKVLVALSGGPDSVCLLHLLHSLREKLNIEIYAAHVNHLIRGDEAFADENYAKELCESLNIRFFVRRVCVESIAKDKGISTEMAGRDERYGFFNEIKEEVGINKIAIAHNANDQAETLIMRIMRGTGLEGLVGIKPVRDNIYIRPILSLTREEIENYCEVNLLNPRIDKTNLEEVYSRNKVRLKAIPFIKDNFNPDIINTLNRLSHSSMIDASFIDEVVSEKYQEFCSIQNGRAILDKDKFAEKEAILTRMIRKALMEVSGAFNNFELKHVYDVIALQKGSTGKRISLTNDIIAINEYGNIVIAKEESVSNLISDESIKIDVANLIKENIIKISFNSHDFSFEVVENNGKINFKNTNEKYFSFEGIKTISLRTRKNGDKIVPFGFKGTKKLKEIFISSKIPQEKRNLIPIIDFDDEIAWVVGIRNSELFKINRHNSKLVKISFCGKE